MKTTTVNGLTIITAGGEYVLTMKGRQPGPPSWVRSKNRGDLPPTPTAE
ncbi:hypothetical protein [Corynebacterium provencense]|nr:hypothetical protein [Corynebacterium provencense]